MSACYLICTLISWTEDCYYSELQRSKPWQREVKHLPRSLEMMGRIWSRCVIPPHCAGACMGSSSLLLGVALGPQSVPDSFVLLRLKVLCEHGMLPPWLSVASKEVARSCHSCLEGDTAGLCSEQRSRSFLQQPICRPILFPWPCCCAVEGVTSIGLTGRLLLAHLRVTALSFSEFFYIFCADVWR